MRQYINFMKPQNFDTADIKYFTVAFQSLPRNKIPYLSALTKKTKLSLRLEIIRIQFDRKCLLYKINDDMSNKK